MLFFIQRAIDRFGARKILLFSGMMTGLRLLVFSQATGLGMLIAGQLMQGVTYISVYYCSVVMLDGLVPGHLKSTGQSLLSLFSMGLSGIAGSMGGGCLGKHYGIRASYYFTFWLVTAATTGVTAFFALRSRARARNRSFITADCSKP